jgi:5-methylcytosine-specific restriction protein A
LQDNDKLFSEIHHIIPYYISKDDSIENLLVLCPTCHRKFHYATIEERKELIKRLESNFPNLAFRTPLWLDENKLG